MVIAVSTPDRLTDERLAWLAAKDYCDRQARVTGPLAWLAILLTRGRAAGVRRLRVQDKLMDYGLAVDDVSRRLTAEERATLRAANQLPDWFIPAVEERFKAIQRQRNDD